MRNRNNARYDIWWFLLCWMALCLTPSAFCTTVTGQAKLQGVPFNGYLDVALVYPATTGSYIALPGAPSGGHQTVTNGYFEAMNLEGNDTLLPRGTYYTFTYSDVYGQALARLNYVVTGATYDIGAAVPTPVTTNNINFLDLLGIRNFSANNVTITNQIQIGPNGAIFGQGGLTNAKTVNDVRYASAYLVGSSTCGIQEAMADLPNTGGTVWMPIGSCNLTSAVTVTKPVHFMGHGAGGPQNTALTAVTGSSTIRFTGASAFILKAPASGTPLSGVTFSNFAIIGSQVTGSDAIYLIGAAGAPVRNTTIDQMVVYGAGNYNIHIQDGAVGTTISNSFIASALSYNIFVNDSGVTNITDDTLITGSVITGAGQEGMYVSSSFAGLFTVVGSGFINNNTNGITIGSGSVNATLRTYGSAFSNNSNAGINLVGGFGHVIDGATFGPGTRQQYGLLANYAGASATQTQVTVLNSTAMGNLTDDFYLGATLTRAVVYPQTYVFTDPGVHNVFGSGVVFVATGAVTTTPVLTPTLVDYYWTQASTCVPALGNSQSCESTVNLPGAMPDISYFLLCGVNKVSGPASLAGGAIETPVSAYPTASGGAISVWLSVIQQNSETVGPSTTITCHAHHN